MVSTYARPDADGLPPAAADEFEKDVAMASSGTMQIGELLDKAQRLNQQGLADASARLYEHWIAHTDSPLRHVACFNWGTVLGALHRHTQAEAAYRQALALRPDFLQARLNLGHQLEHQGRGEEALAEWRAVADRVDPQAPDAVELKLHALNNTARLCELLRRYDEAEQSMAASLALRPAQLDVVQHYVHLRQKKCAWPVEAPVGDVSPNQFLLGTSPLAMLSASDDPALQLLAAQRFVHERVPKPPVQPLWKEGTRSGRIKVGYLSGDLGMHAVGLLTAELFELHDRRRFEVYGFCWSREDGSALRRRLVAALDHHVPIGGIDDASAARMIARHGIDVLVDLQGLTHGARPAILGMRPAPVQVGYLGFPGTTALPGVDWILADPYVIPAAERRYFVERPLYVPHCYQVSDRHREVGPKPDRATYGLPQDAFVYCSFNNNFKFTEPVFRAWMRVLGAVPGSVLWLLADNPWARENMLREAAAHGIAAERLIFAPRVAPAEYLARFALADLVLDTYPYNAGTTASDALWMGVPLLTCSGRTYISRMAGSLLHNVGLPDLVTDSLDAYERLAIQLGRHPRRVASLRRYLAEHGRQSALFDVPARVRDIEAEFERLALAQRDH